MKRKPTHPPATKDAKKPREKKAKTNSPKPLLIMARLFAPITSPLRYAPLNLMVVQLTKDKQISQFAKIIFPISHKGIHLKLTWSKARNCFYENDSSASRRLLSLQDFKNTAAHSEIYWWGKRENKFTALPFFTPVKHLTIINTFPLTSEDLFQGMASSPLMVALLLLNKHFLTQSQLPLDLIHHVMTFMFIETFEARILSLVEKMETRLGVATALSYACTDHRYGSQHRLGNIYHNALLKRLKDESRFFQPLFKHIE